MTAFWTIASLIDAHMGVHAYCDDCRFHKPLDLQALADRLGGDHPAMSPDLRRVLVCPQWRKQAGELHLLP